MSIPKPETVDEKFAQRLNKLRLAAGMTYEGLSEAMREEGCPIHPSALQKTEKAGRKVTLHELAAYSKIFATPIGELLDEDEAIVNNEKLRLAEEMRELAGQLSNRIARLG